MNPEMLTATFNQLQKLREPFPPNQISLLPKPTKKREEMDRLPKARCQECGGWHATSNVIHLSYVGHAALTDRLLDVDPSWTWEPLSMTSEGLPVMDPFGGMWIKLTVCGVTRLGYGHAGEKQGGDAIKEVIGDALRNAAMRFGAALELWHKGDLHVDEEDPKKANDTDLSATAQNHQAFGKVPAEFQDFLRRLVPRIIVQAQHKNIEGVQTIFQEAYDNLPDEDPNELKKALWSLLDSKTRTAISAVEKK